MSTFDLRISFHHNQIGMSVYASKNNGPWLLVDIYKHSWPLDTMREEQRYLSLLQSRGYRARVVPLDTEAIGMPGGAGNSNDEGGVTHG